MKTDAATLDVWVWCLIGAVLLAQSIGLFIDARKKGHYPWMWGLYGLISAPGATIVYIIVVYGWLRNKKRRNE